MPHSCVLLQLHFSPLLCMRLWLLPSLSSLPNYILCFLPFHPHSSISEQKLSSHLDFLFSLYLFKVHAASKTSSTMPLAMKSSTVSQSSLTPLPSCICGSVLHTLTLLCLIGCYYIELPVRLLFLEERSLA